MILKPIFILLITLLSEFHLCSQSQNSVYFKSDEAVDFFNFDIERVDKGSLMFLDVPYQRDTTDTLEYLTLTVAISKTKNRPDFISIIVPSNIQKSNGIYLEFAKRGDLGLK
jgi:hypothetical protein